MYKRLKILLIIGLLPAKCVFLSAETVTQEPNPEVTGLALDELEKNVDAEKKQIAEQVSTDLKQVKDLVSQRRFEDAEQELQRISDNIDKLGGGDVPELKRRQLDDYMKTFRIKWANALMNEAYDGFRKKKYDMAMIKAREAQGVKEIPKAFKGKIQDFVDLCQRRIDSEIYKEKTSLEYKDVDPGNKTRNYEIDVAMKNARMLLRNKQYIRARDAFEKILVRDPYNMKATESLKKLYKKLVEIGNMRRRTDRYERMSENQWQWVEPVLPVPAKRPKKSETIEEGRTSGLAEKLSRLVLKEIDFTGADIQSVVKFLAQESKRIDSVDGTGVNIVLGVNEEELANIPPVTMHFENMPLNEVIRYLCQMCNLKYRIEEQVLTIGTDAIDEMDTRFFKVRSALISKIAPLGDGAGGGSEDQDNFHEEDFFNAEDTFSDSNDQQSSKRNITSEALKSYFEERGVPFPESATIAYSRRSGKLTVKNTHENLRRLDTLLRALDVEQPQVLIESKFIEIAQVDLEEIGFEWWVTPVAGSAANWEMIENNSLVRPLGTSKDGVDSTVDNAAFGRVINDMVLPAMGTDTQFTAYNLHMILHALNQSTSAEVLSAPKVIAKNGEEATIRMVREEYYPDSWTAPELVIINGQFSYTPPTPEFGEPSDIGIRLTATPTVSPDNHTISLVLNPQVVERTGWTNYNISYIFGSSNGSSLVMMPETSRRDINATVKTYDGDTLVLGGMLTEAAASTDDSFPGSNKVPVLGFLGRMQTSKHQKRNLMIFITARIINPDGLPVRISRDDGRFDFRR